MDFRGIVDNAQGGFEELVGKIPGYKGYKEKELRREADKLLREKIAGELMILRRRLNEGQMELLSAGLIKFTDDLERAIMKLQILSDRIKTATYGYSGLFDAVKVKEDHLDALYAFDYRLLEGIPEIAAGVDKVLAAIQAQEEILPTIRELVGLATHYNELFSQRQDAIYHAGQTTG